MRWLLLTAAAHQAAGAAPLGEDVEDASSQLRAEPPKASGELLEPPPALKDVQAAVDALGKIDLGRDLAALQQAVAGEAGASFAELGVATPAPTPKCGGSNHDYQCDGSTDNLGDPGCGGDGICHERQECTQEDGSTSNGCFCTATSCPTSLQTTGHVMCHGADCVQLHSGQCRLDDDCDKYGSGVICDSDPNQARSVGCCITTPDANGHAHIVSLAERQAEAADVPSGVTLLHHPNCAALAHSAHHVPQDDHSR